MNPWYCLGAIRHFILGCAYRECIDDDIYPGLLVCSRCTRVWRL